VIGGEWDEFDRAGSDETDGANGTCGIGDEDGGDHIVHQVRVATIGDLLLEKEVGGRALMKRVVEALQPKLEPNGEKLGVDLEDFVKMVWWMTALFHDCLYTYGHYEKHVRTLQRVCKLPLANPTQASWHGAHKALTGLVGCLYSADIEACEKAYHQFASAAELAMQNAAYEEAVENEKDEKSIYRRRRRLLFSLAAEAILTHHKPRASAAGIRFRDCPIGYLLVLSDELHETDRARLRAEASASNPRKTVLSYQEAEIKEVRAETDTSGQLTVSYGPPGLKSVRDEPVAKWRLEKEKKFHEMLAFGSGELFAGITVRAGA
jgi:hypothetical protein